MNTATTTDQTAAARADRDHAAISALGITTRDDSGNDDVEEQASELLYQQVHVLRDIPEDDRAELDWS